ncbi:MAG: hypothetical protein ACI8YD_003213, partial [Rheinheimera aquimaris]
QCCRYDKHGVAENTTLCGGVFLCIEEREPTALLHFYMWHQICFVSSND